MTRTFSLPSEGLGYFIGYTLFHSDRVGIVSPWLSDIEVTFPVNTRFEDRQMYLSEAIERLERETDVIVLILGGQQSNEYIQSRLSAAVDVHRVEDLHAKAVVGEDAVYVGSANITHGGLMVNKELCQIVENEYDTVEQYIEAELDFQHSTR
jgi:phosphatidylserine/phosphatidylglycerophosphate/cardiolipin synthase-like enzyme